VLRLDQDIFYLFQNRFKSPGQSHSCELRMVNSDAKTIWVRLAATSHAGEAGEQVLRIVMTDISEPVMAQAALQAAHQHLRTLSLRQQEEFDHLRGELARDLHDQLGQTLSTLKLEIDMMAARAPDAAQRMYHLVKEGVSTVRDVSRALRPVALELGLGSALRAMAAELSRRTDVDIQVRLAPGLPALAEATERALYRIAQEALTNAANHAGANVIEIALAFAQDRLTLQVLDDGRGIPATDPGSRMGLGLIGMRERAKLLGAALSLETAPGQGTRITVVLTAVQLRSQP
jgi:signal transduction histidine kinase